MGPQGTFGGAADRQSAWLSYQAWADAVWHAIFRPCLSAIWLRHGFPNSRRGVSSWLQTTERRMKTIHLAIALAVAMTATAEEPKKPLVLEEQGSFFVGGETKTIPLRLRRGAARRAGGDITVNQMYVQYQIPVNANPHVPVVMVHGCCLSSKTWETTPDGRMGWNEYFVRKNRPVYLADQVSRARSGFDATQDQRRQSGDAPSQPSFRTS